MNYAIIGTGGIGGYYGSRLAQSGRDVHFLLHCDYAFVGPTFVGPHAIWRAQTPKGIMTTPPSFCAAK